MSIERAKVINDHIHHYLASGRSWYQRDVSSIKIITVHHDAIPHKNQSSDTVLNQIFGIHHDQKGWAGTSYHYYIHTDGQIYQLNFHEDVTWHDSHNWDSIGIVLHGYFHPDFNNKPTDAQLKSLAWLLNNLCTQHPEFPASFSDIRGHRERWSTACPGDSFHSFVVDYREKQGNVSWGSNNSNPPDDQGEENMSDCLVTNTEENRKKYETLVHNSSIADQVATKLELGKVSEGVYKADNIDFDTIDRSINARIGNTEALKSKISVLEQEVSNRKEQTGRLEDDLRVARQLYSDLLINEKVTQTKHEEDRRLLLAQIEQLQRRVDEEAKQKGKVLLQLAECQKGSKNISVGQTIIDWIKELWQKTQR